MIDYPKLIALACVIAFMAFMYSFAYDKGYQKHKLEVERQATEIIVDGRNDIITAAKEAQNAESNIKNTVDCNAVWDFNIGNCLSK